MNIKGKQAREIQKYNYINNIIDFKYNYIENEYETNKSMILINLPELNEVIILEDIQININIDKTIIKNIFNNCHMLKQFLENLYERETIKDEHGHIIGTQLKHFEELSVEKLFKYNNMIEYIKNYYQNKLSKLIEIFNDLKELRRIFNNIIIHDGGHITINFNGLQFKTFELYNHLMKLFEIHTFHEKVCIRYGEILKIILIMINFIYEYTINIGFDLNEDEEALIEKYNNIDFYYFDLNIN